MSRVGKSPVVVPASVQVNIQGSNVQVKGPKGEMKRDFSSTMDISLEDGKVLVQRPSDEPVVRALHGTTRALIQNMVTGVSEGFVRSPGNRRCRVSSRIARPEPGAVRRLLTPGDSRAAGGHLV